MGRGVPDRAGGEGCFAVVNRWTRTPKEVQPANSQKHAGEQAPPRPPFGAKAEGINRGKTQKEPRHRGFYRGMIRNRPGRSSWLERSWLTLRMEADLARRKVATSSGVSFLVMG